MEFTELMKKRRAVNFFDTEKAVDKETLREVIETAALTPSGFNFQPWGLVVVSSQEEKAKLRELAWNQPKVSDAPAILVVLGDKTSWREGHKDFERAWKDMVEKGLMTEKARGMVAGGSEKLHQGTERSLAFAVKNAGMFAMALMLAAKDAGLDTHPMEGFDHAGVLGYLGLDPERYFIPMLIAVGHFDKEKELGPAKYRKSYDELVLEER